MTDDLRTRAREAAWDTYPKPWDGRVADRREAFIAGALWHATQQPTREQIARAAADDLYARPSDFLTKRTDETWRDHADRIGAWVADALLNGGDRGRL